MKLEHWVGEDKVICTFLGQLMTTETTVRNVFLVLVDSCMQWLFFDYNINSCLPFPFSFTSSHDL